MKVLVDTNVILDVCFERAEFQDDAKKIFALIEQKKLKGCISSTVATDIYYMARKQFKNKEKALWTITRISQLFKILKADEKSIKQAIALHWSDFEDSVQYAVAKRSHVKAIITRNTKDYAHSHIPVYTPKEFLELTYS
ncbi:MAG: PIN domain-containing protein [Treponema sp.]|mgnify:CR=1 FL=1|nr:PIN domain-containing protein [Treponema sp.]